MIKKYVFGFYLLCMGIFMCSCGDSATDTVTGTEESIQYREDFQQITYVADMSFPVLKEDFDKVSVINPDVYPASKILGTVYKEFYDTWSAEELRFSDDYYAYDNEMVLLQSPNQFYLFSDEVFYSAGANVELGYSLTYYMDDFFEHISIPIVTDLYATDSPVQHAKPFIDSVGREIHPLTFPVVFQHGSHSYSGYLIVYEDVGSQYYYLIGSASESHFTEQEIKDLCLFVNFDTDTPAELVPHGTTVVSECSYGKRMSIQLSDLFHYEGENTCIVPKSTIAKSVEDLLMYSIYYNCHLQYSSYRLPEKSVTNEQIVHLISGNNSLELEKLLKDADGRQWYKTRDKYFYMDLNLYYDCSNLYFMVDGDYVYFFALHYDFDGIDYTKEFETCLPTFSLQDHIEIPFESEFSVLTYRYYKYYDGMSHVEAAAKRKASFDAWRAGLKDPSPGLTIKVEPLTPSTSETASTETTTETLTTETTTEEDYEWD